MMTLQGAIAYGKHIGVFLATRLLTVYNVNYNLFFKRIVF